MSVRHDIKEPILLLPCPRRQFGRGMAMVFMAGNLLLLLAGFMLLTAGLAQAANAASGLSDYRQIGHGGLQRQYKIYLPPAYRPGGPALPMVVALHGGTGTADNMVDIAHFDDLAARENFVVLYPEATTGSDGQRNWNDGRDTTDSGVDDVGFITALVGQMIRQYGIDPARVYVTGVSNGGFMTERLACEAAGVFAGFSPVIATMPVGMPERCRPGRPVPILLINGTADPFVPWQGGEVRKGRSRGRGGMVISMDRVMQFWLTADGCHGQPRETTYPEMRPGDGITVSRFDYSQCAAGGRVMLYRVNGGGHTWPGARSAKMRFLGFLLGPTAENISATDEIWRFFKGYTLPH